MEITDVIARMKDRTTGFKSVGGAAELDAAMTGKPVPPVAFVIPLAEAGEAMDTLSSTDERVAMVFGVVHVVANRRDTQGAAALTDLAPLRRQTRAALVGWIPDERSAEPVHFSAGKLLRMDGDGRLWWIDEFRLVTYEWSS